MLLDAHSVPDGEAATAEEWVQRATLVSQQLYELTAQIFVAIKDAAPILLHTEISNLMLGIGHTLALLRQSGETFMGRQGIAPLDFLVEQRRVIADALAESGITDEDQERLAQYTAILDEQESKAKAAVDDWMMFVKSDSGEVH